MKRITAAEYIVSLVLGLIVAFGVVAFSSDSRREQERAKANADSPNVKEAIAAAIGVASRTTGDAAPPAAVTVYDGDNSFFSEVWVPPPHYEWLAGVSVRARGDGTGSSYGPGVTYPLHSLVVYKPENDTAVDWSNEARRGYHYACPREWLARTKEDIRVVALLSWAKSEVVGHYVPGGNPAYTDTWDVVFVDLSEHRVVAVANIRESDPDSPDTQLFSRHHSSAPTQAGVVSAIRDAVSFGQTVRND